MSCRVSCRTLFLILTLALAFSVEARAQYTVHRTLSEDSPGLLKYVSGCNVNFGGDIRDTFATAHNGTIKLWSGGGFDYSANGAFIGEDSFTHQVCNNCPGDNTCWDATWTFNVVNQAPNASGESYNVHGALIINDPGLLANDSDPDGDSVRIGTTNCCGYDTAHGWIIPYSNGGFIYTSDGGYLGTDSFTYQVCDYYLCTDATVTLNVVDEPPNASGESYTVHGSLTVNNPGLLANDSDPDGDTVRIGTTNCCGYQTAEGGWIIPSSNGAFNYQPRAGFKGTDSFAYQVCGSILCSDATVTFNVTNDPPIAAPDFYALPRDIQSEGPSVLINDFDPDGDAMYIPVDRQPSRSAHGDVGMGGSGYFYYHADAGFSGLDTFNYIVCDSSGECVNGQVFIFVPASGAAAPPPPYDPCACPEDRPGTPGPPNPNASGSQGSSSPSAGDPVNLATGRESYAPAPDMDVYNPDGPRVIWQRRYYGYQALRGYSSPGLTRGWVHVFDTYMKGSGNSWGPIEVNYSNGAKETLTPQLDAGGQPTGVFGARAGAPYLVSGVPGTNAGSWQSITITWGDSSKWTFTPSASSYVLSHITERTGRGVYLAWGSNRTLTQVSDATSGATLLTLTYGAGGKLSAATDAYGRKVAYAYGTPSLTDSGNLQFVSQVSDAGAGSPQMRWGYTYDHASAEQLHTITTLSSTGSGGSTATINYDGAGRVGSLVDANGNQHVYTYNAGGTLVEVKDPSGAPVMSWTKNFDASGRETGTTDANGKSTSVAYGDASNPYRPTSIADRNGKVTSLTYDQFGNVLTVTTPRGVTTAHTYDYTAFAPGRLASVKEGAKPATTFTYYEPSGLIHTVTSTSPTGTGTVTRTYTYDALGNILTVTGPGNNAASQITTAADYTSDGAYTQPAKVGQPLSITDNLGHVMHLRYDAQGRITSRTDALGNELSTSYNIIGQVTETRFPATGQTGTGRARVLNSYLYPGGPLADVTLFDESSTQTRQATYSYGPEGELLSVSGSVEPVSYTYDALYRKKTLKDGKENETVYSYNNVGRLSQVQMPGGESVQYTSYDDAGHLLQRIDGNNVTTNYLYNDAENLLTDVQYPSAPSLNVHLGYDSFGRRNVMTDSTGTNSYVYGDFDELKSATTEYTGVAAYTLSYEYNADGSRKKMVTPAGEFSYSYDAAGRAVSMTNPAGETTQWTYFDNGLLHTQQLHVGVLTTYTYNPRGELTRLLNKLGTATLSDYTDFSYDGAGNRLAYSTSVPGYPAASGALSYEYDDKDQLKRDHSTLGAGFDHLFDYDAAGNPTSFAGASKSYNANNQQTGTGFAHDGNGNPTTYKSNSLTFDPENRLTSYGAVFTAGYRGDGLRAWKESSGARTYFIYDGSQPVIEVGQDGGGEVLGGDGGLGGPGGGGGGGEFDLPTPLTVNTFGVAGLVSRTARGQGFGPNQFGPASYYAFDPQGSVSRVVTPQDSSLTWPPPPPDVSEPLTYTAHGEPLTGSVTPWGFGAQWGYYTDEGTGLQLLTNRYYDPSAGRFVTRDPIGYRGGVNLYGYVGNNAANVIDPSGLDPSGSNGWGNDAADWLDDKIDNAEDFYRRDPEHWIANGLIKTVGDLSRGAADMLRVGSGVGHALYDCDDNAYGRAANVLMDVTRAAGLFQLLGGPAASATGRAAGSSCFVAGTLVQTSEGVKRIEEVEAGDVVLSTDAAQPASAGQPLLRQEVARTYVREASEVIDIRVGGETVTATAEHPFWVVGAGWTPAGELRPGSPLLTKGGSAARVESVSRREGRFRVYNFEVVSSHTYYVSALGLLVHNTCGVGGNPGRGRFIVDSNGNTLIEPPGGATVGNTAGTFVETRYPNGSPAQQLHGPHRNFPDAHGHGFQPGGGVNQRGVSLDPLGNPVPPNSPGAHWPVR